MITKEQYVFRFFKNKPNHLFWKGYWFQAEVHMNHTRDDGMPYSVHNIEMAYFALLDGIEDPLTHALIQCHDTVEEARDKDGINISESEISKRVHPITATETFTLTKERGLPLPEFVDHLEGIRKKGIRPVYVKMLDRYSNVRRSVLGVFEIPRMRRYMVETYQILAMAEQTIFAIESGNEHINKGNVNLYAKGLRNLRGSIKTSMRGIEFALRNEEYKAKYGKLMEEYELLKKSARV